MLIQIKILVFLFLFLHLYKEEYSINCIIQKNLPNELDFLCLIFIFIFKKLLIFYLKLKNLYQQKKQLYNLL